MSDPERSGLRIEQALQVVGPRSVTNHLRRQALESAAESLEPTFALEFPKYAERPRGSVVAFALRASARHLAIARLNSPRGGGWLAALDDFRNLVVIGASDADASGHHLAWRTPHRALARCL